MDGHSPGASGYTGSELVRLLLLHPRVELVADLLGQFLSEAFCLASVRCPCRASCLLVCPELKLLGLGDADVPLAPDLNECGGMIAGGSMRACHTHI